MTVSEEKKELRKIIRSLKAGYTAEERLKKSLPIERKVLQLPQIAEAQTILLYHALPDEVNTSLLLEQLSNRRMGNKRIALPVVTGDILILKEYIPEMMESGYNKILEPSTQDVIDPSEIDLAIIPGVAFDKAGNRMGRGKGFYDKLLPYIKCTTVGLAFDFQMVERIPCEEFDKPLDMVITED